MNVDRLADRALALRACAVVLLILAMAGALDVSPLPTIRPFDALFRSGEMALSLLFVCSGWGIAARLLAARTVSLTATARVLLAHAVPTLALLALVLAGLGLFSAVDPKFAGAVGSWSGLAEEFLAILVHPLSRHDTVALVVLTPLVFLLAELALAVVTTLVVALVGQHPALIGWAALVGAIAWWSVTGMAWDRPETLAAQLPVWPHVAGFLAGVAAVALRGRKDQPAALAGSALLVLSGCVFATSFLDPTEYSSWVAPAVILAGACFLVSDIRSEPQQLVSRFSTNSEVVKAGEGSRSAVAWSGFVAAVVWAHTLNAPVFARWAFTVLAAIVVIAASESVIRVVHEALAKLSSPGRAAAGRTSGVGANEHGNEDR